MHPLYLLPSFCILDSNNKMHDENFGVKNLPNFDPVFIFKAKSFQISAKILPKLLR